MSNKNLITLEVFADWLEHPVTKALREQVIPAKRTELFNQWEGGAFTSESKDGTLQQNAKAVGEAGVLRWFQQLDFEQLTGELKNDE